MPILRGRYIGKTLYSSGIRIQQIAHESVLNTGPAQVILLQHNHVYTLGRRGKHKDILIGNEDLNALDLEIFETDRGGEVTYHGPGQLIVYPIVDLTEVKQGPIEFIRGLEKITISTLSDFGIHATSSNKPTGVWVDEAKIASIGIKVSNKITTHGLAININTDLSYFDHIVSCGLSNLEHTSIAKETGKTHSIKKVAHHVANELSNMLGLSLQWDSN